MPSVWMPVGAKREIPVSLARHSLTGLDAAAGRSEAKIPIHREQARLAAAAGRSEAKIPIHREQARLFSRTGPSGPPDKPTLFIFSGSFVSMHYINSDDPTHKPLILLPRLFLIS